MIGVLALAMAQAADPAPAAATKPSAAAPADIAFHATVDARSARQTGPAPGTIAVSATPDGGSTATSSGSVAARHFELHLDARIAPLLTNALAGGETATATPR